MPAATSMAKRMARKTRSVPRSGWSMISAIGMAARIRTTRSRPIRSSPSPSDRPEPRAVQPAKAARHRMTATLANSDGWSWNEPTGNHAWWPLLRAPSGESTANSMRHVPT